MKEKYMLRIYIDSGSRKNKKIKLEEYAADGSSIKVLATIEGDFDIVSELKKLLEKHKLTINQITDFAYNREGESFTGLKSGAAVANVLKWTVCGIKPADLQMPQYNGEPNIQK